jgi:hypothetical protein
MDPDLGRLFVDPTFQLEVNSACVDLVGIIGLRHLRVGLGKSAHNSVT